MQPVRERWEKINLQYPNFNLVFSTFLIFLGLFIIMALGSDAFLQKRNLINILSQCSIYMVMGVGMTLVLTTGGIDISIGSMVGVTTALVGSVIVAHGYPVWLGIIAGLLIGTAMGGFNALFIVFFKVPPIIVTLGTWTMFRGLAYAYLEGTIYFNYPESFLWIARGTLLGLPVPVWIGVIVVVWGHYFLTKTKTGRHITAMGGNEEATRLAGINVNRLKAFVYVLMGFLAGLATLISTARLDSSAPGLGAGYEMHTIASVVIGGTSLFGGRGLMIGTLLGVLMLGIVENGLLLAGVSFFWQRVLLGFIFCCVVAFRTFRAKES